MSHYTEEEHRVVAFLHYREFNTCSERAAILNDLTTKVPILREQFLDTHTPQSAREWTVPNIVSWLKHYRDKPADVISKFFTQWERERSIIYRKGISAFNTSDRRIILEMLKLHQEPLEATVDKIWRKEWPGPDRRAQTKTKVRAWNFSQEFTRHDIERAAYSIIRRSLPEKRDLHNPQTWPLEWMIKLVDIWKEAGGSETCDPGNGKERGDAEDMRPKTLEMLKAKIGFDFPDAEFTIEDMRNARIYLVLWGFIRTQPGNALLKWCPYFDVHPRHDMEYTLAEMDRAIEMVKRRSPDIEVPDTE